MDCRDRVLLPVDRSAAGLGALSDWKAARRAMKIAAMLIFVAWTLPAAAQDWQAQVAAALGKSGAELPGGVYRVALPRTDIKATLDGVALKPGFALGGWLAFAKSGEGMVMGDLVLTMDEVGPVTKQLLDGGIEITALHNHLLRNEPFTMFLHVLGRGNPATLAATLHGALALSKTPLTPGPSAPAAAPPALGIDTAAIDRALGAKGKNNGGVYQFGIPRAETIEEGGMVVPPSMGTAIGINFQPTGGGKAAITGDFVLIAKEVNPVAKALRDHGIEVTALHNHMLDDRPRLYFMHFWANDDAVQLANGLAAALAQVNIAKR